MAAEAGPIFARPCPPHLRRVPHAVGAEVKQQEVAPEQEVVVKSEPSSPDPPLSPQSPPYTLDLELGSDVDVPKAGKATSTISDAVISDPSGNVQTYTPFVFPTTTHFVVVLTPKSESTLVPLADPANKTSPASNDCDSDSGIESLPSSPPQIPSPPPDSAVKPYSKPEPTSPGPNAPRVKSVSGAPKVVERKNIKREQNKTAATRYRQKKRVKQEVVLSECTELEKRNDELRDKAESISREIQYLKDLMEEVRNAKHRRSKTSTVA